MSKLFDSSKPSTGPKGEATSLTSRIFATVVSSVAAQFISSAMTIASDAP